MTTYFLVTVTLILALACGVFSQETNATCSPDFSWASNSLQQSPCQVAAMLAAPCYSAFQIYALTPPLDSAFYESIGSSDCVCNMVFYNLLSCCSECQGGISQLWTDFVSSCTDQLTPVTIANYSRAIPDDTTVPAWAFINVQATNSFSALAAEQFFDTNSSNIGPPSSSTSSSASSTSSSSSPTAFSSFTSALTSSTTSSATPSSSSVTPIPTAAVSHVSDGGAIAGGVVGGIAAVALITFGLVLWLRRSRGRARANRAVRDEVAPTAFSSFPPRPPPSPGFLGRPYNPSASVTFPGPQ
ncbi:hypothetical protein PsYK624_111380 [Phanerochaete sordida]|uniref:Transmembrane protein n=1 Tax=Phanerochaete sordida TaxID=48140 RepID=A0A9P3LGX2_9APHY|nr:hypothetical protein PsYK624_111380 [Phanerochaete sordida]